MLFMFHDGLRYRSFGAASSSCLTCTYNPIESMNTLVSVHETLAIDNVIKFQKEFARQSTVLTSADLNLREHVNNYMTPT